MTITKSGARGINDGTAEEIRVELARRRMNQSDLARTLGVNRLWVSRRLSGTIPLSLDDLGAIADGLDVSVVDLLPPHVVLIGPDPSAQGQGRVTRREPIFLKLAA